jgi:hypothetical protein
MPDGVSHRQFEVTVPTRLSRRDWIFRRPWFSKIVRETFGVNQEAGVSGGVGRRC